MNILRKHIVAVILLALSIILVGYTVFRFYKQLGEMSNVSVHEEEAFVHTSIGTSVEGRSLEAYTFGKGTRRVVFVGGIHGGYEWNSTLLAYALIDYVQEHPQFIPDNLTLTIIPSANPDGLYDVIKKEGRFTLEDIMNTDDLLPGAGRFNAHGVDLNRNFDCKWKPESTWQGKSVSAGSSPFSEPEADAIRDYMFTMRPDAVVFWHSQANAVYASECEDGTLAGTRTLMNTYAEAAGYKAVDTFDAYEVTGDAEGWLASIGIPAITVELSTHDSTDWDKNLKGITALVEHYAK